MASASSRERLRYALDNFLARGSSALFLSLVVAFSLSIVGIGLVRLVLGAFAGDDSIEATRHVWTTFLELTDPGNMNQDNDTPAIYKATAVAAGFTGVVIFSSLIAFLTTALNDAIGHLKKGHSRVLESGHTLIVGWGPRVVEILNEISIAKESESDAVAVVVSDRPKEDMDEHLRTAFVNRRGLRVVTRSGPTASLATLEHVSASEAKAAIVLAACDASAARDEKLASDAHVIKTVLALVANLDAKRDLSIVAEVFEPRNRTVVEDVARGRAVAVDTEEILAKIIVQTSRTSGLAVVYSELLSFDGCEIYFHSAPFGGVRFDELQFRFADGVPIGIRRSDGALLVRPPPHTVVATGDEVIIVAQDDSSIRFKPQLVVTPENRPPSGARGVRRQERMLVIGWSAKAPIVVREFAQYVLPGSWVDVFVAEPDEALEHDVATLDAELPTLTVRVVRGNPLSRDELAAVDPFGYANVLILRQPARGEVTPERIDAESIVVLLHLRRLWAERGVAGISPTKIITEVHDSSNQELINRAGVNDFIISERLVSMIFAQLSEEPRMKLVYDDLFQESGSEIYVKPASLYFDDFPVRLRFADAMRTAQLRNGEVCIGYKLKALEADASKNFGVSLVPPKDTVLTLGPEDALVVVAEDEG